VRLESLCFCSAAHALYKSAGSIEIAPHANSITAYQPPERLERYRTDAVFLGTAPERLNAPF